MLRKRWFLMDEAKAGDGTDAGAAGTGEAGKATGTVLDGAAGDAGKAAGDKAGGAAGDAVKADTGQAKGYWPDDWQRTIAGQDEKELKQIARYASPAEIWKKARSLEHRLSSGELKSVLPKEPKPEELAAWRKDNGIPEKPEAYDLKDLKIPDTDKEIVAGFLKAAHGANMTPEQAKIAVSSYYAELQRQIKVRVEKDEEERLDTINTLAEEWGGTFTRNKTMVENLLNRIFSREAKESLINGRCGNGRAFFNDPEIMRGLAALALEMNPAGIIVPASGGDLGKSIIDRYNELQKLMREDRGAYNKYENEYRKIITTMQKHGLMDDNGELEKAA